MSTTEKLPYRRRARFTAHIAVAVTPDTRAEIETEADAEQCAAADIIRQCLSGELPRMRERRRKRRTRGRTDAAPEART